jgi:hypothetical protein
LQYIREQAQSSDAIATTSLAAFIYRDFYKQEWTEITSAGALEAVRIGAERTWIVYTFPPVLKAVYPEVWQAIQEDFMTVRRFDGTVGQGEIYVALSK